MITLLLSSVLLLQDPAAPKAEWKELDGIVNVINEDVVTRRGFLKRLRQYLRDNPGTDPGRARDQLSLEIVRATVGAQAGEAMGIDANLIKRSVRDYEKRMIEARGGVDQYAAFLAQNEQTAEEMREEIGKYVLRDVWESSRTGKGPNQQQKVIADRYVRPGTLRFAYSQIAHDPRLVSVIGGSPSKVVLQILEVDPVKVGGTAQTGEMAQKIRDRIASGQSDFEPESGFALSNTTTGEREPFDESALAGVDEALAKAVAAARPGEVLAPIPPRDKTPQWRVVKLVRRIPAAVPAFAADGVQKTMRDLIEGRLDARRLELAQRQQYDGSYIWPPLDSGR